MSPRRSSAQRLRPGLRCARRPPRADSGGADPASRSRSSSSGRSSRAVAGWTSLSRSSTPCLPAAAGCTSRCGGLTRVHRGQHPQVRGQGGRAARHGGAGKPDRACGAVPRGINATAVDLSFSYTPNPGSCLSPGSLVQVRLRYRCGCPSSLRRSGTRPRRSGWRGNPGGSLRHLPRGAVSGVATSPGRCRCWNRRLPGGARPGRGRGGRVGGAHRTEPTPGTAQWMYGRV